ncbi:hypothetical protein BK644_21695 [Pseudomonas protegens]|nr:hypothetical protein BK644_21695 [Pseudomonas protegens]
MAGPPHFINLLTGHTHGATRLRQAARFGNRTFTVFADEEGMRRQLRFQQLTRRERLIEALLHQIVGKIRKVSHGPPP